MTRKMIVNAIDPDEVRLAIVEDGRLADYDIETRGVEKNRGNIYKAVVAAVEPALNAAFVNYGADKQGFLTAHDVDPKLADKDPEKTYRINELLKPKQEILVQITKDEVGQKGAVLTTYLSLAGRYLVLMPGSSRHGVSRKIDDDDTRKKMKEAAAMLDAPDDVGVIIRTAGKDRQKADLNRDLKVLVRLWENIQREAKKAKAPALIFKEQDVIIRALRDNFTSEIDEVILDSDEAYDRAAEYMGLVMPKQKHVLTRYVERRPIFHHYRIEEQLEALYSRKVTLRSGGSIVVEQTEALVSIDVNSGKQKLGGQEETALYTNLDAAQEVARQLRLRDMGGIIVVDFIDLASRKHELRVERAMRDACKNDRARIKIGRISPNGTLELTRQRIGSALLKSMFRVCSTCEGTGHVLKPEAHAMSVLRKLRDRAARGDLLSAKVRVESEAANILRTEKWGAVGELEQRFHVRVDIIPDHSLPPGHDDCTYETDPNAKVIELEEPDFGPAWRPDDLEHAGEGPDEDEELDDEDVDEADAEDEQEEEAPRGRRGKKERKRRDEGSDGAEPLGEAREFAMPTFELLDPAELRPQKRPRRERDTEGEGDHERKDGRRSRRGRRGRGRGKDGKVIEVVSAESILADMRPKPRSASADRPKQERARAERPKAAPPSPVAMAAGAEGTGAKKPSFLARLFGRK